MGMFYGHNQSLVVLNIPLQLEILTTSSNQSVTIPHLNGYTYNYTVDYGDGSGLKTVTSYNDTDCTNIYTTPGTYTITISGICESIYVNNTGTLRLTVKKVLNWGTVGLKLINFYGCSNLTDIVTDNIGGLSKLVNCSYSFTSCKSLTSIPSGLFDYCTQVSTNGFYQTFYGCSSLTSIPVDLFRYNTQVSSYGFYGTFQGCSSLTSIPTGLFRYNTQVSIYGFYATFYGCTKLQLNPWIFYASGEQTTRFSGVTSINFQNCFYRTSFNGIQGTAPDLWNCTSGGSISGSGCFKGSGNSSTSISNYSSIPLIWIN